MPNSPTTIRDLLRDAGRLLRAEFEAIKTTNPHFAERGAEAEIVLRDLLRGHLPRRFDATSGLVIDDRNELSRQIDVLVYDALNSPVIRPGPRLMILPSDNVAAAIEVKSRLTKAELEDAAAKIASVKSLAKTPITDIDQPVTSTPLVITNTLGVVFAYDSATSLETIGDNLRELNASRPSSLWTDLVVVLDQGVIGYAIQMPFSQKFVAWFGGAASEDFLIPPVYVHLVVDEFKELTLNRFFIALLGHLTFFRKRSSMSFQAILGAHDVRGMTLAGYQYNLKRELVDPDDIHKAGDLLVNSIVHFSIFSRKDNKYLGQVGRIPWKDGAVVSYSGYLPPEPIFRPYYQAIGQRGFFMPDVENARFWLSSVIPLSEDQFVSITENMSGVYTRRDSKDDDNPPWIPRPEDPAEKK